MAGTAKVEFSNRQQRFRADRRAKRLIRLVLREALRQEGVTFPCLISCSFVTKAEIRRLNRETRAVDRVTDVLSYPLELFDRGIPEDYDPPVLPLPLGDIVLCPDRAREQAREYGHSVTREVAFLTVHSLLHLLGYDHETEEDERQMRDKQEAVLQALGITRD
ncbi:MAG: rRNA maturation RNase YbeY [Clostridia bacterium]|nr:rRNA maturation RNase YbeY [Clostridia bacterium]